MGLLAAADSITSGICALFVETSFNCVVGPAALVGSLLIRRLVGAAARLRFSPLEIFTQRGAQSRLPSCIPAVAIPVWLVDHGGLCLSVRTVALEETRMAETYALAAAPQQTLVGWHQFVAAPHRDLLAPLLADNVVFHSPVVHSPQVGKAIAIQYLSAAFHVFFNETFMLDRVLDDLDGLMIDGSMSKPVKINLSTCREITMDRMENTLKSFPILCSVTYNLDKSSFIKP